EPGIKERKCFKSQCEMAGRNDDSAEQHAAVLSQSTIRDQTANDCSRPDAAGVRSIDGRGIRIGKTQTTGRSWSRHLKDQERAHSVVNEALPHFRKEECRETTRMR